MEKPMTQGDRHDPKTQLQMYYLRQSTCKHLLPGMWLEWSSTPEMRHLGLNFRGVKQQLKILQKEQASHCGADEYKVFCNKTKAVRFAIVNQ